MEKEIRMQVFSVKHVINEGALRIVATITDHARVVQEWINNVSNSLKNVEMKIVGLDAEYTTRVSGKIQCAAVLQLCLGDEVLVYHIMHAPSIPGELHDFLSREDIFFCGAAIEGDKKKLAPYNLDVKKTADLQSKIPVEGCDKQTPSLFDIANFVLGTKLDKGDETLELRTSGWEIYPLTYERIKYAALDARVSFEIAARSKELVAKPSPTENEKKKKKKKK
jgi:ribonuclease D